MKELLVKLVLNLGVKAVSICLVLAMHVYFARWLSPGEYGQFILMQVITLGLATFAQAGMQSVYLKLVAETEDLHGVYRLSILCISIIIKKLVLSGLGYCLISFYLYFSGKVEGIAVFVGFFVYLVCQVWMFLLAAWYRAINKAYVASFIERGSFSGLALVFSLAIYMVARNIALTDIVIMFAASVSIVTALASVSVIKKILAHRGELYDVDEARVVLLANSFLTIHIANYVRNWAGVVIVGALLLSEQVAQLGAVQRIAQVIIFFLISFNGVLAPRFAKLSKANDLHALKILAQKSAKLLAIVTLPVVIVVVMFGRQLLGVFGPEYVVAYPLLLIVMSGQFVNALTGSVGNLLIMTNYEAVVRKITLFDSVVGLCITLIATWLFGLIGAALSIAFGVALNNLITAFFVYKYLGFVTVPGLQWVKSRS